MVVNVVDRELEEQSLEVDLYTTDVSVGLTSGGGLKYMPFTHFLVRMKV